MPRLHIRIGQVLPRDASGLGTELWVDDGAKDHRQFQLTTRSKSSFRLNLGRRATLLAGYTFSKSIDDASNLGEQINPFNERLTRVISSWDMTHNFVATYTYALPFDRYFGRNRLTEGWSISGTTRFATGFPVTLFDDSDRSLLGNAGQRRQQSIARYARK